MFLSEESRQSARVIWHVLIFPLYDGNCSPAARRLLEVGDVDGAIAEWQRLADLGSGRARCVLAFVALTGTASKEPDIEEARRLATSALSGERGYANFVLGCIAIKERRVSSIAQYLGESNKAGFLPAATLLASLAAAAPHTSAKSKSGAERMLRYGGRCGTSAGSARAVWLLSSRAIWICKALFGVDFVSVGDDQVFSVGEVQWFLRRCLPVLHSTEV